MKITAIISEFNPLHFGHKRLIDYAKSTSDVVVCVLSGHFVQRGMPSVADKWQRAKHAIQAGADIVVQLPTIFATASAKDFALGGVSTALQVGADTIVFGSISGDVNLLKDCANQLTLCDEKIKQNMKKGNISYPSAVALALPQFEDVLSYGNDTLGIEYILASKTLGANVEFDTIKRNYDADKYCTASIIRKLSKEGKPLNNFLPDFVKGEYDVTVEDRYKEFAKNFFATQTKEQIENTLGVAEGLENLLEKAWQSKDFDTLMSTIKSKRYTQARLQRIILANLLGITKENMKEAKSATPPIKILAVKEKRANELLTIVKETKSSEVFDKIESRADKVYFSLAGGKNPTKLPKY